LKIIITILKFAIKLKNSVKFKKIAAGAMVVTQPAHYEPQSLVIKVNTEIQTKSAKKRLRRKTSEVKRGFKESDDKIIIELKDRERNLIMKKNYQHYGEPGNDVRRKTPFVS
jgi:hypothetical protein